MSARRGSVALVWVVCGLLATRCFGVDAAVSTDYDVRYGPLTILSLHATTLLSETRYSSTSEMRTVGAAAFVFPWHSSAKTEGERSEGRLRPRRHRSNGEYRGQRRSVAIEYGDAGAVTATVEPPADADFRQPVPAALQPDTIDPLTATLSALASECRGSLRVFDGRRRYDLLLTDLGDTDVPGARGALYAGRARRCQGEIHPLAGFWKPDERHDERPSRLDYWIAVPRADLPAVPVYMELSSARGTLSIVLTSMGPLPTIQAPK